MKGSFSLFETVVQSTMEFYLFLIIWILTLPRTDSVTYLRPKNDRGPGTRCLRCLNLQLILTSNLLHYEGAMKAGIECLEQVERQFFKNDYSQQIQNLAVFHSKNLSSPASEIEGEYLFQLHDRVLHQEDDEESFQLKLISDVPAERRSDELPFTDIALTDFYVLITDKLEVVSSYGITFDNQSLSLSRSAPQKHKIDKLHTLVQ